MKEMSDLELEKQVTSLEPSKELKKLGVKQDSLWYWVLLEGYFDYQLKQKGYDPHLRTTTKDFCSAFTVAEHGEMLPDGFHSIKFNQKYRIGYNNDYIKAPTQVDDKEADARAKMRIWLIKNKLMGV